MSLAFPKNLPHLPRAVTLAGARLVPATLQRLVVEAALARTLGPRIGAGDLDFLEGRVLCIEITDLDWRWPVTLVGGILTCLDGNAKPDCTIRGRSAAFADLALRRTDPDTVFFQRELAIEGDTEVGLAAKNFLDSVEWDRLPIVSRLPVPSGFRRAPRP